MYILAVVLLYKLMNVYNAYIDTCVIVYTMYLL